MDEKQTVEILCWIALIAAPIVAGMIAGRVAVAAERPRSAALKGFFVTWLLGVALGGLAGLLIDSLFLFQARGGYMIAAFALIAFFEVPVSAAAGLLVGLICAYRVRRRNSLRAARLL